MGQLLQQSLDFEAQLEPPPRLLTELEVDASRAEQHSRPAVQPDVLQTAFAPSSRAVAANRKGGGESASSARCSGSVASGRTRAASASPVVPVVTGPPGDAKTGAAAAAAPAAERRADDQRLAQPSGRRIKTVVAQPGIRALSIEEEALQQSLLRLDFEEMKRQFAGKDPLWRKELPDESLKPSAGELSGTQKEEQLAASLQRLGGLLSQLQVRSEEAQNRQLMKQQQEQQQQSLLEQNVTVINAQNTRGECDDSEQRTESCPSRCRVSVAAGRRVRPRSAGGQGVYGANSVSSARAAGGPSSKPASRASAQNTGVTAGVRARSTGCQSRGPSPSARAIASGHAQRA